MYLQGFHSKIPLMFLLALVGTWAIIKLDYIATVGIKFVLSSLLNECSLFENCHKKTWLNKLFVAVVADPNEHITRTWGDLFVLSASPRYWTRGQGWSFGRMFSRATESRLSLGAQDVAWLLCNVLVRTDTRLISTYDTLCNCNEAFIGNLVYVWKFFKNHL